MDLYFWGGDRFLVKSDPITLYTKNVVDQMTDLERSKITKLTDATLRQLEGRTFQIETKPATAADLEGLEIQLQEFRLERSQLPTPYQFPDWRGASDEES